MDKQPSREELMHRVARLEAQLQTRRNRSQTDDCVEAFGLADMMQAADGICVCHATDQFPFVHFTFWNRRMVELTGYDMETINRQGWYQSVYPDPDHQARAIERMAQMREGVHLEAENWEITRADGDTRTLRISTSILDQGDGTPRVMAIMHDVTEMKRFEAELRSDKQHLKRQVVRQSELLADVRQALQVSDARYHALFNIAGDALFVENEQDEIIDANQKACDLLGYSREELLSMKVCDIQAPECRDRSGRVLLNEIADYQGEPFETLDLHKDGTVIPVEVTNTQLKEAGLFISIVRDVRERKLAEKARQETYDIIEQSPVVVFLWRNEDDWPVEFVTHNVGRIFGYSDADFLSGKILYSQVVHPDDLQRVAHEVATNSKAPDRIAFTHEPYRIVAKDGSVRWINDQTHIRRDHRGAITHYQGIVEDITIRVNAEQARRESEEKFSRIFQLNPDTVIITRLSDGMILDVNDSFTAITGYLREEVVGRSSLADLNLWADRADRDRYIDEIVRQGTVHDMELRFRVKSGETRLGSVYGTAIDLDGDLCIIGTIRDITERKQVEAEILYEKHFSETVISHLPGSFYMFTEDGQMMRWNGNLSKVTGYSSEEIVQMNALDFFPEDEKKHVFGKIREVFEKGRSQVTANFLTKDGRTIPHVLTGVRMKYAGTTYLAGVGLDMTEEIKVKNALIESETRFRQIAENIKEVFWLFDWQAQQVLYVSPAFDQIWGQSRDILYKSYDTWGESIHPEDRDDVRRSFSRILESGGGELREYRIVRPDGTERWISDTGYAITDDNGSVVRIAGIAEDITERKHTQEALAAERERLAVTLRSIGDAVITTDREGGIVLMNPIAEKLTGWTEADALGRPLMEVFRIVDERSGVPCANPVDKVLASGQIVALANHTVLIANDGQKSVIADSGAPILNARNEIIGVVLVFRDITGQQHIEKELLKMEKLKSLGVLAGGIAHDFNNFLTGIIGNLSLAKLDVQPGHPLGRPLVEMERAALRAKELTQQLLTFSKGGEPVKHATRIDDLVRECARFTLHGSNVRCDIDVESDLHPADVDEGQIAQVLNNLMINADQAMPQGGIIRIRVTNIRLAANNSFALDVGDYIQIIVKDEGMGIQPAHLKKVFDPYFTTKQKGSGLGLAVAYSIIAKHDGQLTVESELGQGTTFTIVLPSSKETQPSDTNTTRDLVAGHGRVLVMDDEDFIRELASDMMEKMGYEVVTAQDGQSAVDIYQSSQDDGKPFDAVVLDLTVHGGMGGRDALRKLIDQDPEVKAIVSSGYSNDPIMANYEAHGFKGAVKKPYLVQEMSRVLHDVINGH